MDIIRNHQIKVIGLNVPRSILRTYRAGSLVNYRRKSVDIHNPAHEYFIKGILAIYKFVAQASCLCSVI